MTMRKAPVIFVCTLLLHALAAAAQKEKTIETEYTYCAPPSMSPLEARQRAIEAARTEAIANEFGRIVSSNSFVNMMTSDTKTTSFNFFSESEIKGEWVSDVEKPTVLGMETMDDMTMCFTVRVKGVAREIVSAPIRYEKKILRNGTDDTHESDDFKDGDRFYMSFRSPANGYLVIYMLDEEGKAYRLLPYPSSNEPVFRVEHDKRYVLFDAQQGGDGIQAYCTREMEFNHIYTIFSPHPFTRSLDNGIGQSETGLAMPPELSMKEFQKWFMGVRKYDKDIAVDRQTIRIKKQ